jgi:hypothetical protein
MPARPPAQKGQGAQSRSLRDSGSTEPSEPAPIRSHRFEDSPTWVEGRLAPRSSSNPEMARTRADEMSRSLSVFAVDNQVPSPSRAANARRAWLTTYLSSEVAERSSASSRPQRDCTHDRRVLLLSPRRDHAIAGSRAQSSLSRPEPGSSCDRPRFSASEARSLRSRSPGRASYLGLRRAPRLRSARMSVVSRTTLQRWS